MSMTDELGFVDATIQAEMVRNGEVTPVELVDAAIERVERLNPALNAVITPMYDEAREAASRPIPEGPFSGVPFLVKDFLAEYAGVRFTESSNFIGDFVPDEDAELVKRWKRAGLIAIGKTNLPEMAIGATTEPVRFGPTRNPWDTTRTPGGSSGGAGSGGRLRHGGHGPRERRRGLHPHTGGVLWGVRPQADAGAEPAGAALRGHAERPRGRARADPQREGLGGPARRHRRALCRRPLLGAAPTEAIRRGGLRRPREAPGRVFEVHSTWEPPASGLPRSRGRRSQPLRVTRSRGGGGDTVRRLGDALVDLHDRHGDGVRLGGGRLDSTARTGAGRGRPGAVRRGLR